MGQIPEAEGGFLEECLELSSRSAADQQQGYMLICWPVCVSDSKASPEKEVVSVITPG